MSSLADKGLISELCVTGVRGQARILAATDAGASRQDAMMSGSASGAVSGDGVVTYTAEEAMLHQRSVAGSLPQTQPAAAVEEAQAYVQEKKKPPREPLGAPVPDKALHGLSILLVGGTPSKMTSQGGVHVRTNEKLS